MTCKHLEFNNIYKHLKLHKISLIPIHCQLFIGGYPLNYSISVIEHSLPAFASCIGIFVLLTVIGKTSWSLFFWGNLSNQKRISNTLRKLIPVRRPNIPPENIVVNHWWIIQIKCIVKTNNLIFWNVLKIKSYWATYPC